MPQLDLRWYALHRKVYYEMLDALPKEIAKQIMDDPNCDEAILFNERVAAEIKRRMNKTGV